MDEGQARLLRKLNDKQGVSCSTSTTQLCDLPDSLLHHILLFLPTKFAFKTSVLSKRWQHVSESMPCLRFGERDFQNFLCDAVESALRCRDMSCSIQEFSLECSLENGIFRINRWIAAAVKRNVKVLKLFFATRNLPYRLSHRIFMSETLVELELDMHAPLLIPTSTDLSNLKILTLRGVVFVDEESTQKLLSCPTLEELSIYFCGWKDIKLLKVYAPSLLKLSIWDQDDPLIYLDERSDSPHTCQVLIQGAQIRSLTCCSWFINKYCITTSPLLLDAKVYLDCNSETAIAANNASMLLNGLSSAQILTLNSSILEQIFSRHELVNALPTFSKLTMLSLKSRWYSWAIFEKFPHLETLEYLALSFDDTPSNPPDLVPVCFRSHLKKIVVDVYEPKEEVYLNPHMVQLLGISTCLEELVIRYYQEKTIIEPKELLKRLTLLPKASANCRISVVVRYGKNLKQREELGSCAMDECQAKLLLRKLNDKQGVSSSTSTTQLCDLPDSLLHHILSFLPTKFAFRTSVLSKRWHHVTESMPCLLFHECDFQNQNFFGGSTILCDAVDSALLLRDMSCSIQEFCLTCSVANGNSRINRWITAAVKRNVKVLKLFFVVRNLPYQLPHCIFMSETLVELELSMVNARLIIPTSIRLSNLKILTLGRVVFVDEESTQKLLSCPTLEELSLCNCYWTIKLLKVSASSLVKLLVLDGSHLDLLSSDFLHTCQVLIQGAQIRSLVCRGRFWNRYCITTSPLLLKAEVNLDCDSETEPLMAQTIVGNNASMFLNRLSSVQSLTLNSLILEQICRRDELFNALPTFSKLTMLSLDCSGDLYINPACRAWYSWEIFQRFPHLETLEYVAFRFNNTPSNPPDSLPICFRSHLKKIVVYKFQPRKANISHMVQLLGISMCLEELVIHYDWDKVISRMKPKVLMKRLTRLPRASANCRISLVVRYGENLKRRKVVSC